MIHLFLTKGGIVAQNSCAAIPPFTFKEAPKSCIFAYNDRILRFICLNNLSKPTLP